jgi:hypothetical protein
VVFVRKDVTAQRFHFCRSHETPAQGGRVSCRVAERRRAARDEARPCLHPRDAMTIRIDEAPARERTRKIHTPTREVAQAPKREERSHLASFPEAECAPKPLVAFDEAPEPAALPQTW